MSNNVSDYETQSVYPHEFESYTCSILRHMKANLRQQLWNILHYGRGKIGQMVSYVLIVCILLSVAMLPLEYMSYFENYALVLNVVEVCLTAVFTAEYVLRIYAAPRRLRYALSFFGMIDLLSILPFYLSLFGGSQSIRVFRMARLLRLLKLSRIEAAASIDRGTDKKKGFMPDEKVEYVVSRHPIVFLIGMIPVLAATIAGLCALVISTHPIVVSIASTLFIFAALFLYKAFLDFNFDVIYVTSQRLIFYNQHLVGHNMNQVNYRAITNVRPTYPGIFSYFLGFGSIVIETPAEIAGKIEQRFMRCHEEGANRIMNKAYQFQRSPDDAPASRASNDERPSRHGFNVMIHKIVDSAGEKHFLDDPDDHDGHSSSSS